MAKYKWAHPADWLDEKVERWAKENNTAELVSIIHSLRGQLDSDGIQDVFQYEMEEDGYFKREWNGPDSELMALDLAKIFEPLQDHAGIQCYDEETHGSPQGGAGRGAERRGRRRGGSQLNFCRFCGASIGNGMECDNCWEVERRLRTMPPTILVKILRDLMALEGLLECLKKQS